MLIRKQWGWFFTALSCTIFFVVLTVTLLCVDVQSAATGPIGWATINLWWRDLLGVQNIWHLISDIIVGVTLLALVGMLVWQFVIILRGKSLRALTLRWWVFDITIIVLGLCYLLFQFVVINYRPIVLDGIAEVSYPSSHILLVATLWPLILCMCRQGIKSLTWRRILLICGWLMLVLGVIARLCCGYHWFTDVLGALLLSTVLVTWFQFFAQYKLPANR